MRKFLRQTLVRNISQARSQKVGFIGLGNMGGPMALNLKNKGGFEVLAFDPSEQAKKIYGDKLTMVKDPLEICDQTDTYVTMLPSHI